MKQLPSNPLTTNTKLSLPSVLMKYEQLIENISKKVRHEYETAHKLFINNKHWSKLASCIDDVRIVDSQYNQKKSSKQYETFLKLSTNNKHWSKLTFWIDDV